MRIRFIAPPLLAAAVAAVPAAAQVEGDYRLVSINNQPLPVESPTEAGVIVHGSSVVFGTDGRFSMSMTGRAAGGEHTQQAAGTYVATRESIRLTPEPSGGSTIDFRWMRRGDTLRIHDRDRNEFRFVRQAAQAGGEAWSPGTWALVEINGHGMPAPWMNSGMTVTRFTLRFTADGRLTSRMFGMDEGRSVDDEDDARFRVQGDKLLMLDSSGDGSVEEEIVWFIRDGTLRLVDDDGDVLVFRRQ
ncbi:hypothetical protein [Longimicrobium sp.]|uniref:hypothetical protein n=1 Tax=Longimicrobium sp. TaxID=2029185 RepID=UPI002E370F22|nr:hypothetical protein [Longimicrobium sp.]HEX6042447.1 hypothetical protein [Longimicrobium sp.]